MRFANRREAGRQLAARLSRFRDRDDTIVLGIPRGGVPVAYEIATALRVPLDVLLSRKLGVPGHEEVAFGALAANDGRYLDQDLIRTAGITPEEVARITTRVRKVLEERARMYREGRQPVSVQGKIAILVDDGVATGASLLAAIHALRQMKPKRIVLAVPVAPANTCTRLAREVDEVVLLQRPDTFYAVGEFYRDFSQTSDEEVIRLLRAADQPHSTHPLEKNLTIPLEGLSLEGVLAIPPRAEMIAIFVHGSGSSRLSKRNLAVARAMNRAGIATLLFDLLTSVEEEADRSTAALRFDIDLLTSRLIQVTRWVQKRPAVSRLKILFFGASTGAAAALKAAAALPEAVKAVVSRGSRPDLAGSALSGVQAPTLLIVGGHDETGYSLNRAALQQMPCKKLLAVIPGATHLFEEPGALDEVTRLAIEWCFQNVHPTSTRELLGTAP